MPGLRDAWISLLASQARLGLESLLKPAAMHRGNTFCSSSRRKPEAALVAAALLLASSAWASAHAQQDHAAGAPAAAAPGDAPVAAAGSARPLEFSPFNDQLFLRARKSGVPVVLYFEADWCAPCKEMDARTFRAPAVVEAAAGLQFFRVDMTTPSPYLGLLEKSFRVTGAPTVIVFGPDGKERKRRFGFIPPEAFVKMLDEGRRAGPSS